MSEWGLPRSTIIGQDHIDKHEAAGTHLRESAIVPDVTMMGEAVANEAQLALFDVLLDGIEGLLLADLHFGVGPAGNFDDHVQDTLILVGEERDIMERRDNRAILLNKDAMVCKAVSDTSGDR